MKRMLVILLLTTLFACGNETTISTLIEPVPDQEMQSSVKGLSLTLSDTVLYDSPDMIETVVRNDSGFNYTFGGFYHIEMKVDGLWHMVTYSDKVFYENRQFEDFGKTLAAGNEVQQLFSVESLGLTLIPGEYRLVKSFSSQGASFYEISIAETFWLE